MAARKTTHVMKKGSMLSIGDNIRMLRLQRGMSQKELGDAVGVSRAYVAHWETNLGGEMDHLERIAEIFGVPAEFFLNKMASHDTTETLTIDEADLLRLYRRCDIAGRLSALRFIESKIPE
jgi:transcriptional regulator with XRE-family HTH domain